MHPQTGTLLPFSVAACWPTERSTASVSTATMASCKAALRIGEFLTPSRTGELCGAGISSLYALPMPAITDWSVITV